MELDRNVHRVITKQLGSRTWRPIFPVHNVMKKYKKAVSHERLHNGSLYPPLEWMICAVHDNFTNIKYFTVLSLHVQLKKYIYLFPKLQKVQLNTLHI